jgi:PiT family inorganic phosphate transporter
MSYSIGANDAANALGTSYGSNAAKLWMLLVLGAIFELVGAVYCSSKVAGTLADKLLPTLSFQTDQVQERLMLGTCLASFSFILFASFFGMPISGTHTVIGALVGAGLAGLSANSLNWTKFGWTVASWFISPVLSSILAGLLFLIICSTTLGGNVKKAYWKMQAVTLISAFALGFSCFMVITLAANNPTKLLW